ncbi:Pregnancy-associated plasma protein-A [Microdochium nivale]|nr:Pregnancy-associated plasma protein-A [Microdochium nivale]
MHILNIAAAAVALAPLAAAHYDFPVPQPLEKRDAPLTRGCASKHSEQVYEQARQFANKDTTFGRAGLSSCSRPLQVDTYFHAAVPRNASSSYMSVAQMQKQLDVMNIAYAPHDITFVLKNATRIADDRIADFSYTGSQGVQGSRNKALEAYWKQTRVGDYKTLHVWFYNSTPDLLGICSFPDSERPESEKWLDGCHVDGNSLPGGAYKNYNLGGTAIHEVGHWFGLFHVFQDQDCDAPGDLVSDTPAQSEVSQGCPLSQDSCPSKPGVDSIHNFMDYSYDTCYEEFTEGQENRMHNLFRNIREVMW